MARRGFALPLQPDLLTGGDAGRNLDIEFLAGRQPDAPLRAVDRLFQRHRHGDGKVEVERDAAGIELGGVDASPPPAARPNMLFRMSSKPPPPGPPGPVPPLR